ncbi:hypothetical protein AaE_003791, partial [Aphanomyces astaci]
HQQILLIAGLRAEQPCEVDLFLCAIALSPRQEKVIRVDTITSVELAVTLSKKLVTALRSGDIEVVACLGDFASHVLEL